MGLNFNGSYGFGHESKYGMYNDYDIVCEQYVYGNTLTEGEGIYCRNETHTFTAPTLIVRNESSFNVASIGLFPILFVLNFNLRDYFTMQILREGGEVWYELYEWPA